MSLVENGALGKRRSPISVGGGTAGGAGRWGCGAAARGPSGTASRRARSATAAGLRAELHRHPAARHAARAEVAAVPLYLSGPSMDRTAKLLGVSTPSAMAWIERFAEVHAQKPEPEGRAVAVELDERGRFLKKGEQALGLEGSGSCYKASG